MDSKLKEIGCFMSMILFCLIWIFIFSIISALAGTVRGYKYGCHSSSIPHSFESRIDYIFPLHDLSSEWARKAFKDSDLCRVPEWFSDPVYLEEIKKTWHKEDWGEG